MIHSSIYSIIFCCKNRYYTAKTHTTLNTLYSWYTTIFQLTIEAPTTAMIQVSSNSNIVPRTMGFSKRSKNKFICAINKNVNNDIYLRKIWIYQPEHILDKSDAFNAIIDNVKI